MARNEALKTVSLPADGDLSASQFRFMDIDTAGRLALPSAAGRAVGVLQDKPDAIDKPGALAIEGIAKVVVGAGGITAGDILEADAAGGVVTFSAPATGVIAYKVGVALETAAAVDIAEVLIQIDSNEGA